MVRSDQRVATSTKQWNKLEQLGGRENEFSKKTKLTECLLCLKTLTGEPNEDKKLEF